MSEDGDSYISTSIRSQVIITYRSQNSHSTLTPASCTTFAQRATSAVTNAPKSAPVISGTSEPLRAHASLIDDTCRAVCSSFVMRATIGAGVFFGAQSAYQVATS